MQDWQPTRERCLPKKPENSENAAYPLGLRRVRLETREQLNVLLVSPRERLLKI